MNEIVALIILLVLCSVAGIYYYFYCNKLSDEILSEIITKSNIRKGDKSG